MIKKNKVFVIGFHKTGTTSISEALEVLGYKTIHGDPRNAPHGGDEGRSLLQNYILKGNYNLPTFELYDAFTDNPYFTIWEEILRLYPDAKYILTFRDEDKWIESCTKYYKGRRIRPMRKWMYGAHADPSANEESRQAWLDRYRVHNHRTMARFEELGKELLIFNMTKGHGWGELCAFLGVETPLVEFPHRNKSTPSPKRSCLGRVCTYLTIAGLKKKLIAKKRIGVPRL